MEIPHYYGKVESLQRTTNVEVGMTLMGRVHHTPPQPGFELMTLTDCEPLTQPEPPRPDPGFRL